MSVTTKLILAVGALVTGHAAVSGTQWALAKRQQRRVWAARGNAILYTGLYEEFYKEDKAQETHKLWRRAELGYNFLDAYEAKLAEYIGSGRWVRYGQHYPLPCNSTIAAMAPGFPLRGSDSDDYKHIPTEK